MQPELLDEYRSYRGTIEFSEEDDIWHGRLVGIDDIVAYAAPTKAALQATFEESVDEYLDHCHRIGKRPEVPRGPVP